MSLGAAILAYGSGSTHEPLLASLLEAGVPGAAVTLVHNPARPGEPPPAAPPGVEVVQSPRNLGYAGGMNLGLASLRRRGADPILILTHDARLRPGALEALLAANEEDDGFGVLGPALLVSGTDRPFSFGGLSRPDGTTAHIRERPAAGGSGVAPCDWVDGGTMLVRAAVFERVGDFDERFWSYCEESDLCLRARRAGFGVGVVLGAEADQDPGGAKRLGVWSYLLTRNGTEYARRAAGGGAAARLVARSLGRVAVDLLRVPLRLVRRRPGGPREPWLLAVGTLRGAIDFLRGRWGPPPPGLPGMGDVTNV
jgi:N-acetylglucosaminyl-diphospho-decaprenol L-rhamnosyltransferase